MSQLVDVLVAKTHKSPIVQVDEKALLAPGEGKISSSLLVHVWSLVKFPPWVPFKLALEDYRHQCCGLPSYSHNLSLQP